MRLWLNPKARLCSKLEQAAVMLDAFGEGPIWSRYDSAPSLAQFIRWLICKIEDDSISAEEKDELWCIFAPTCDWDDTVGHVQMGEDIFGLVQRVFPETKPTGTQKQRS